MSTNASISHKSNDSKGVDRHQLIPILQDIQTKQKYLSRQSLEDLAIQMHIPLSKIYGVATFYNQFKFNPPGQFHIQICRGTACHVLGSLSVQQELEAALRIKAGQTTRDGLFSLEVVACIGACGLAPVISVNGNFHAKVKANDIQTILDIYREKSINNEHN